MLIQNKQVAHISTGVNDTLSSDSGGLKSKVQQTQRGTQTGIQKAICLTLSLNLVFYYSITPVLAGTEVELDRVVAGQVSIDAIDSQVTDINQASDSAIIDWRSFSIDTDETVNFNQPSAASVTLNRVTGGSESQILGHLSANGQIFLINPKGILFGQDSTVDVAGMLATTSDIDNDDFLDGRYAFSSEPGSEDSLQPHVTNQGRITARDGGLVALVAPGVENSGTIYAQMGQVSLASGTTFTLDLYGDQLIQLALDNNLAEMAEEAMENSIKSSIENSGAIYANGGTVVLDSRMASSAVNDLINMSGVIQARSIEEVEGQILLTGGHIEITGLLDASGGQPMQSGGTIEVFGSSIQAIEGASIDVSGIESGGFIELSGANVNIDAVTNLMGANGSGGTLLIDPVDLVIDSAAGTDVVTVSTIESALASGGDFIAEAEQSISVNATIDTSAQTTSGTLSLNDENSDGILTVNLNQQIILGANQSLDGEANLVNVADGASIQNGVHVSINGATVNVAAGTYSENVIIDKTDLSVSGSEGATLLVGDNRETGFSITADGVDLNGMTITGPFTDSFTQTDWDDSANHNTAINVSTNLTGIVIENNIITNVRTGMTLGSGSDVSVNGNLIDNTKGSILVRTDNALISGNQRGSIGSEWDIVFFGVADGAYATSPNIDEVQYGADIMALSSANASANGGMWILDRRYGSGGFLGNTPAFGNRSHVSVLAGSTVTEADDFGLGNGLGNERQPLATINEGIDAVVHGGVVDIQAGAYSESVSIDKSVTLNGAQAGVDARGRSAIESILTGSISIEAGVGNLLIDGLSIAEGAVASGEKAGIAITSNVTDITIQNTIFSRSGDVDGDTYRGIVSFSGGNQTGLLIQNNSFSGWATGIFLNPTATGAKILNNDFDGNFVGVSVDGPDGTVITGNLFANNVFEGLGIGPGEDSPAVALSGNTFDGNTTHIGLYTDMTLDAASNAFDGTSASAMTIEQLLLAAEKIADGTNGAAGYSGLVSLRDAHVLVTAGQSINNAIDLASVGDTVAVGAGTYNESVSVDKSITLSGVGGTVLSLGGSLPLSRIVNITADGVTVEGFGINGGGTHVGIAIPGQNARVSNNQINNVLTGIQTNTLNTEGNNNITGNTVTNSGYGISLQNNSNTVTGNTIDVTTEGFGIGSAGNTITGNNLSIGSDGVHLQTYDLAPLPGADIDLQAFLNNNQFDRALYITDGSNISVQTIFGNIQNTIDAASSGETVSMLNGTYSIDSTLNIDHGISLVGASEANTIIDASSVSGYGVYVTADDVSLNNFTLYGPSANSGNSYGIKVNPDTTDATDRLSDFSIANVSIRGSGRAELDLNGVSGALISNVMADGRFLGDDTMETAGAGIQLTDSANITLTNVETLGNAWGSVALYQANRFYDQQTGNININAASNTFSESDGLFSQDSSDSLDFGTLNLTGFSHTVRNADFRSDGSQFTFYKAGEQVAIDFALALDSPLSSTIQGWSGTANTNAFTVGISTDGTVMNIGNVAAAAPNGATINVAQGTYNEDIILNGDKTFIFDDVTVASLSAADGSVIELGGSLTLSSLSFFAAINLADDLTISADQSIALNSVDGDFGLNLSANSVELASAGTSTALASLDVSADSISVGSANTSGAQAYEGAVVLNGNEYSSGEFSVVGSSQLTVDTNISSNGDVQFGDSLNGAFDLIITGVSVGLANVGDTTVLNSLDVTANTIDVGNAETSAAQNYVGSLILNGDSYSAASFTAEGAVELATNTSVTSTGEINFTGNIDGAFDLELTGASVNLGDVGSSTPLNSLAVVADSINVGSVSSTGSQSYEGDLTLEGSGYAGSLITITGATQIMTDANISASNAINFSDDINGSFGLVLNGTSINLGDVGNTTALASLDIQANTIALGSVSTSGNQAYEGAVVLNGSNYSGSRFGITGTSVLATNVSINTSGSNGDISFSDDIDGTSADEQDLTLNAGTGSVTHMDVGQAVRLRNLTVTAGNYDGSSGTSDLVNLTVNAGDISVGNSTVNAFGLVSMFGHSITGSINAKDVQLEADETVSVDIVATETANVSAQNIENTSISAETIEIEATETVSADINANEDVSITAKNIGETTVAGSNVSIDATESVEIDITATQSANINAENISNTIIEAADVSITALQSIEAQISATQTVAVQAQNVSNTNIDAAQVTISATENVEVEVNAVNEVVIQAENVDAMVSAPVASIEAEQSIDVDGDVDTLTIASEGQVNISGDVGTVEFDSGSGNVGINGSTLDSALATSILAADTVITLPSSEYQNSINLIDVAFDENSIGDVFTSNFEIGRFVQAASNENTEGLDGSSDKDSEDDEQEQLRKFLQGSWSELVKESSSQKRYGL